jgi:hypothetical protein
MGQKGDFIGDPSGVHVHIVGRNDHIRIGNSNTQRKDINFANKASITTAMDWLKEQYPDRKTDAERFRIKGYKESWEYLRTAAKEFGRKKA